MEASYKNKFMKFFLTFIFISIFFISYAQNKKSLSDSSISNKQISQKSINTFFQGTKWFCCYYRKSRYKLTIKGSEISITLSYKENESTIKGIIKNGKIYSNDPLEKGNKMLAGKVYLFKNNTFRVLTSEGGEYDEFTECKQ